MNVKDNLTKAKAVDSLLNFETVIFLDWRCVCVCVCQHDNSKTIKLQFKAKICIGARQLVWYDQGPIGQILL